MSLSVQRMFDSIAGKYDFLNHFLSGGRDIAWRKKACRSLPTDFNGKVIDSCGGTGDFLNQLQKERPGSNGIVVDFSINMLEIGKKKYSDLSMVQVDALELPFFNDRFDAMLNGFGMRNLDDLAKGIAEATRVIKPNGYFVTLEFFKPSNFFTKFFYGVLAPILIPLFGAIFSKKKDAYQYLVRSIRGFVDVKEYVKLCEQAGWEVVKVQSCDFGLAHSVTLKNIKERINLKTKIKLSENFDNHHGEKS